MRLKQGFGQHEQRATTVLHFSVVNDDINQLDTHNNHDFAGMIGLISCTGARDAV
jgi:hypothetical protein